MGYPDTVHSRAISARQMTGKTFTIDVIIITLIFSLTGSVFVVSTLAVSVFFSLNLS